LVYQQLKSLGIFKAFIPRPAFKKYEKDRGSRGKDKINIREGKWKYMPNYF
jgi:hypothetical protein